MIKKRIRKELIDEKLKFKYIVIRKHFYCQFSRIQYMFSCFTCSKYYPFENKAVVLLNTGDNTNQLHFINCSFSITVNI